jgi:hypothetical protein
LQILTFPWRTIIFCEVNLPPGAKCHGYSFANKTPHRLLPERHSPPTPPTAKKYFETVLINSTPERKNELEK